MIHQFAIKQTESSDMDISSSTIVGTGTGTGTGNGSLSHQHSLTYLSSPQKSHSATLRDASFSTYTQSDDDHLNQGDDSELSIFDAQKYFNDCTNEAKESNKQVSSVNHHHHQHVINLQHVSQPRLSAASSLDEYGRNYRGRSFNATPTASSEASWNSKTGLLSNPPGAIAVSMRNPTISDHDKNKRTARSASKWLFGRKCPCSGKKSVQVEEKLSEPKTPPHLYNKKQTQIQNSREIDSEKSNWIPNSHIISSTTTTTCTDNGFSSLGQRVLAGSAGSGRPYTDGTTGFTFPILNQTSPIKLRLNAPLEVDPPRESLEIFQPSSDSSTIVPRKSLDQLQRRMLLARQAQAGVAFPASPKSRMTTTDDDVASDASSDLFEIESFSTQTTSYPMYLGRDSLDEASSFNARRIAAANNGGLYCGRSMDETIIESGTECYEPSEASIDWSVTTAEGFDRASVTNFSSVTAQEMDEMMRHDHHQSQKKNASGVGGPGRSKRGNGSLLLSCRCEKAVSVGPNPVKYVPGESATKHVNCRSSSSKPPLARSHSCRLSLPFAT